MITSRILSPSLFFPITPQTNCSSSHLITICIFSYIYGTFVRALFRILAPIPMIPTSQPYPYSILPKSFACYTFGIDPGDAVLRYHSLYIRLIPFVFTRVYVVHM